MKHNPTKFEQETHQWQPPPPPSRQTWRPTRRRASRRRVLPDLEGGIKNFGGWHKLKPNSVVLAVQLSFHFAWHSSISAAPKMLVFGNFAEFRRLVGPLADLGGVAVVGSVIAGGEFQHLSNRTKKVWAFPPPLNISLLAGGSGADRSLEVGTCCDASCRCTSNSPDEFRHSELKLEPCEE